MYQIFRVGDFEAYARDSRLYGLVVIRPAVFDEERWTVATLEHGEIRGIGSLLEAKFIAEGLDDEKFTHPIHLSTYNRL